MGVLSLLGAPIGKVDHPACVASPSPRHSAIADVGQGDIMRSTSDVVDPPHMREQKEQVSL